MSFGDLSARPLISLWWIGLIFMKAANSGLKMSLLQILELCLHSRQLEEEKRKLSDKDAHNLSELENLRQQLTELMSETQRRESLPADEKMEVSRAIAGGGVLAGGSRTRV